MNSREKKLGIAVLGVIVLWLSTQGLERYRNAVRRNQNLQAEAERELSAARTAAAQGLRARGKLRQLRSQSLPVNHDIAESLYQDWLQAQLSEAGMQVDELADRSRLQKDPSIQRFTYQLRAKGKLAQLAEFLHRFYQAPHLQRISAATISPSSDRTSLSLSLTVDAMSLADCDRTDQLAQGEGGSLAQSRDEYRDEIVGRNMFVVYKATSSANSEAAGQASSGDSEAAQAMFSGMTEGLHGWRMSIRMQDSGKLFFYRQGDPIHIGQFQGTIAELDSRQAIIETDGKRLILRLGQNLGEAKPLADSAG